MASKVAIGIMRNEAIDRLQSAMVALFGEGFTLPTQGRDPALLHAQQLGAIADYLDCEAQKRQQVVEYTPPEGTVVTTVSVPDVVIENTATVTKATNKPGRRSKS